MCVCVICGLHVCLKMRMETGDYVNVFLTSFLLSYWRQGLSLTLKLAGYLSWLVSEFHLSVSVSLALELQVNWVQLFYLDSRNLNSSHCACLTTSGSGILLFLSLLAFDIFEPHIVMIFAKHGT